MYLQSRHFDEASICPNQQALKMNDTLAPAGIREAGDVDGEGEGRKEEKALEEKDSAGNLGCCNKLARPLQKKRDGLLRLASQP